MIRTEFLTTLPTSRSSLPLIARCRIRLQAGHADFYITDIIFDFPPATLSDTRGQLPEVNLVTGRATTLCVTRRSEVVRPFPAPRLYWCPARTAPRRIVVVPERFLGCSSERGRPAGRVLCWWQLRRRAMTPTVVGC